MIEIAMLSAFTAMFLAIFQKLMKIEHRLSCVETKVNFIYAQFNNKRKR